HTVEPSGSEMYSLRRPARRSDSAQSRLPVSNRVLNRSSSSTGTPSDSALSSFDPALSPATTSAVFFDTELAALPPADRIASFIPSRVSVDTEPVFTIVSPSRVCSAGYCSSSSIHIPAVLPASHIAPCHTSATQSRL